MRSIVQWIYQLYIFFVDTQRRQSRVDRMFDELNLKKQTQKLRG